MSVHPLAEPFVADGDATSPRGRVGILLSHGFTGSPASMKPWAEYLAAQGYAVSVPRLPGHGTTWQDMNKTTWADWYGEVERAFEALANQVDTVVVCGLSMGGGLALRLAADHPDRVAGLVLVNPAVAHRPQGRQAAARSSSTSSRRCPGSPTTSRSPASRSTATPRRRCGPRTRCSRPTRCWWPTSAAVTCPILLFRSTEDHVVDPSSAASSVDGLLDRRTRGDAREQLPRRDPGQRRPADLRGLAWPSSSASPADLGRDRGPDRVVSTPRDPDDETPGGHDDLSGGVSADEAAWRSIIDNYGDRPEIADEPEIEVPGSPRGAFPEEEPEPQEPVDAEEHFVPPPPPPLPLARTAAAARVARVSSACRRSCWWRC